MQMKPAPSNGFFPHFISLNVLPPKAWWSKNLNNYFWKVEFTDKMQISSSDSYHLNLTTLAYLNRGKKQLAIQQEQLLQRFSLMLVLDWVQMLWGCLYPVSTSMLWVLILTFQPIRACGSSPCRCSCVQIHRASFSESVHLGMLRSACQPQLSNLCLHFDAMLLPKEITSVGCLVFESLWNSPFQMKIPCPCICVWDSTPFLSLLSFSWWRLLLSLPYFLPLSFLFFFRLRCLYLLTATPIMVYQTDNLFKFIGPCKTQFPYNVLKRSW